MSHKLYVYKGNKFGEFFLYPNEQNTDKLFLGVYDADDIFQAVKIAKQSLAYAIYL